MQGGDKLCCVSPTYSNRVNRLCRKCNIQGKESGNPLATCKRMSMIKIQQLVRDGKTKTLKKYNQYNVDTPWFRVNYGGCQFGIFSAASPVEPLHALEIGLISDCLTELFSEDLKEKACAEFDAIARKLTKLPRQSFASNGTDKDMPRLLWKDGVTELKDVTASGKVGKMFTVVVVALQDEGRAFFCRLFGGEKRYKDMLECFQMMLCYWVWLKKDSYWRQGDKQAKEEARSAIRVMLHRLINIWPRTTGQGWELAKVHEQLHVPDDIERNGPPKGTHSGPTEHNHICHIKRQAKRTQKRRMVLDQQIGTRVAEQHIINTSFDRMDSYYRDIDDSDMADNDNFCGIPLTASKGIVKVFTNGEFEYVDKRCHFELEEYILDFVIEHYLSINETNNTDYIPLEYFSEYKRFGTTFRCHPEYRNGGAWYDWVMIRWETSTEQSIANRNCECNAGYGDQVSHTNNYSYSPGHLKAFINNGDGNIVAVVQSCEFKHKKSSIFTTEWKQAFVYDNNRTKIEYFCIIDVASIVRKCLIIPKDKECTTYNEIWPKECWAEEFL